MSFIPSQLILNTTFVIALIEPICDILDIELSYEPNAAEFEELEHDFCVRF